MGVLADRLDAMRVRVSSPDGQITAELTNRTQVSLWFTPGSYRWYDERRLEAQLTGLAKRLWASRTRAYLAAASEAFGYRVTAEPRPVSPRDVAYRAARDELVAAGWSADGWVYLAVAGMRIWQVRIADGGMRALTEHEFAARVGEAAGALIRDQFAKIRQLKQGIYG